MVKSNYGTVKISGSKLTVRVDFELLVAGLSEYFTREEFVKMVNNGIKLANKKENIPENDKELKDELLKMLDELLNIIKSDKKGE